MAPATRISNMPTLFPKENVFFRQKIRMSQFCEVLKPKKSVQFQLNQGGQVDLYGLHCQGAR